MNRRALARIAVGALALSSFSLACAIVFIDPREPLVDVSELDKSILVDIRYSTNNNFTKTVLYPVNRCLLRRTVAKRLALAQADLAASGLGLKVLDCYRPLSVQRKLWALVKDPRYVADPKKGSRHNRGAAVDATLVSSGAELEMPSGYDEFSERAHRDYLKASSEALHNRDLLETVMTRHGFVGLPTEWWHFDSKGWERYPLLDVPLDAAPR